MGELGFGDVRLFWGKKKSTFGWDSCKNYKKGGLIFLPQLIIFSKTWDSSVEFITQSPSLGQNMHGFNISGGHISSKLSYGIKITT